MAAKKLAGSKKITPSVTKAIKASPAGMFPAVAAKSGITMGSKLGQAITKSGAGKLPSELKQKPTITMTRSPEKNKPTITMTRSPEKKKPTITMTRSPEKKKPTITMTRSPEKKITAIRSTGYQANKPAQVQKPKPRFNANQGKNITAIRSTGYQANKPAQVQKPKPGITNNYSKNNANQAKNIASYNKNMTNMADMARQRASAMKNIAKPKAQMYLGGSATFNERGSAANSKLRKSLIARRKKR